MNLQMYTKVWFSLRLIVAVDMVTLPTFFPLAIQDCSSTIVVMQVLC